MSRGLHMFLVLVLVSQTILSSLGMGVVTNAEGKNNDFIKNTTVNENEDGSVEVEIDWSIENEEVEAEDTISFVVPEGILIEKEQKGDLEIKDKVIGTYMVTTAGEGIVTFNEKVAYFPEAEGLFTYSGVLEDVEGGSKQQSDKGIDEEEKDNSDATEKEKKADTEKNKKDTEQDDKKDQSDKKAVDITETSKNKEDNTIKKDALKQSNSVLADNDEKHGFTLKIDKITDSNGDEFDMNRPLNPDDEFNLYIEWFLENGHTYKEGDSITFDLPDAIYVLQEINGELKDLNGDVVATYTFSTDKKAVITFTDYVENHSDVSGHIEMISKLDQDKVEEEDGNVIIDGIGEEGSLTIPLDQSKKKKTIEKNGEPDKGYNADVINWEVIINKHNLALNNVSLKDILPEGTEYKDGSLRVTKVKTSLNGTILGDIEEVTITPSIDNGEFTIPLGDIEDSYRIEYTTVITDEDVESFQNNVTLSDDTEDNVSADATVSVKRNDPIKKSTVNKYDPKTGIIEWQIQFNYNEKELDGVILKDEWTEDATGKLELVKDSLIFEEVTIDEDGNSEPTGNEGMPDGAELSIQDNGFEIGPISTDNAYRITYQTKVKDRVLDGFEVTNTAGFGTHVTTGTGDVGIGQYYGSKSAGDVNYSDKTVEWKLQLNQDEYPMENITVVDRLGNGLSLDKSSIVITVDGLPYSDYDLLDRDGNPWSDGDNIFQIKFPEKYQTKKQIDITYKTHYVADEVEPDYTPTNWMDVSWKPDRESELITKNDIKASTKLNQSTQENSWKKGQYDPKKKEIEWTIYANYQESQIGNLQIVDTPQGNQTIQTDSVEVHELEVKSDGTTEISKTLEDAHSVNNNVLTVNIGETNNAYKIVYRTKIPGKVQESYSNDAILKDGNEQIAEINDTVGIQNYDTYADKTGNQDGKQVHWSVKVNLGQQEIRELQLEDTISYEQQEYLADSIKVYEAEIDVNGKATKAGEKPTPLTEGTDYTLTGPETDDDYQTFTIKWIGDYATTEKAFIVDYSTLFFVGNGETVNNNYVITGDNISEEDGTTGGSSEAGITQLATGGAQGTAGYLKILKKDTTYDKDNHQSPSLEEAPGLEGAVFELIDADTDNVLKTATTDEKGEIDFGRLLFGEYIVKETGVPEEYVAETESKTITINEKYVKDNPETVYVHEVGNYQPVHMIELTKTNKHDSDEFVEGAEYTIYENEEATGEGIATSTTDENGKIFFDNLEVGTYYVKETGAKVNSLAANQFQINEQVYMVTIGDKEKVPVQLEVNDELIRGHAKIKKVDADNLNTGLDGAVFEVQDENGTVIETLVPTDKNGEITTGELLPGTYKLIEKTAPTGFEKVTDPIEFSIERSDNGEMTEIDLSDIENNVKTTNLVLTKQDSINKDQKLEGVKFELSYKEGSYGLDGDPVTKTTDNNGEVTFEDLKPGTYEITETKAHDGYIALDNPIEITVGYEDVEVENATYTDTIENKPLAKITILKQDSETEVGLKGAEFEVKDSDDNTVRSNLTTDEDGEYIITGLPAGTYQLIETKAPKGYQLDVVPQQFEVEAGTIETKIIDKTFNNDIIKGSVELEKQDGDDENNPLKGVEFTLESISLVNSDESYKKDGLTTDENGKIKVDDLRPGTYKFTETYTLPGYQPYWENLEFEVQLQNEPDEVELIGDEAIVNYELVDVFVKKKWNDHGSDELRPKVSITLTRQVGTTGVKDPLFEKNTTLSSLDNWEYIFKGLDAVNAAGERYVYTVEENTPRGYLQQGITEDRTNNFTITNVESTSVKVNKNWKDDNATEARPEVTVKLLRNGNQIGKEDLRSPDWHHEFTNLPKYAPGGELYNYTADEVAVPVGYKKEEEISWDEEDGFTITNVRSAKTDIEVMKDWKDTEDTARPDSITVELYQKVYDADDYPEDSLKDKKIKPNENGHWKHTFKDLKAFNEEGKAYEYKVEEVNVPDYQSDISEVDEDGNVTITNTRTGKTDVKVEKVWKDDDKNDRPVEGITLELYQNDTHLGDKDAVVTAENEGEDDNKWFYTFEDLDAYDKDGKAYEYKVEEVNVPDYQSDVSEVDENGNVTITNTRTGKTDVKVEKVWKDDDKNDRPVEGITLELYQNDTHLEDKDTVVTAENEGRDGNKWIYAFEDLDAYDENGKPYTYKVKEADVDGYKELSNKKNEAGNLVITNVRNEPVDISVTKKWVDTPKTADRPTDKKGITIDLFKHKGDQTAYKTATLNSSDKDDENTWKYTFENLEKYDENGQAYDYILKERPIAGYKADVSDFDRKNNSFTITNTREGTVEIAGKKTWKDDSNKDDDRPSKITVKLLQNDQKIDSKEVTSKDDWQYDFGSQPGFDENGEAYTYTVKEVMDTEDAQRYDTKVAGFDITNTRIGKTAVEGTKTWKDGNATDRPEEIIVYVKANNEKVDGSETKVSGPDWTYKFADLDKYDKDGKEIAYTVDEEPISKYKKEIDSENNITNIRSETTSIKVEKDWKDDNDATEKRPKQITIQLFQNGTVIDKGGTQILKPANDWEYTFTNLDKYDDQGEPYEYTVEESQPVDGYTTQKAVKTDEGFKITNVRSGKTFVEVVKEWNDNDATENRPEKVTVKLFRNGDSVDSQDINPKAGVWKYTFDDLEAFNEDGVAYKYTVKEKSLDKDGYKLESNMESAKGYILTNVATTDIKINKNWLDTDETKNRPNFIEVELFRSTPNVTKEKVDTYTVKADDDWSYTVKNLPVYDENGDKFIYELEEENVPGYASSIDETEHGFDITNLRKGETSVEITKKWKDDDDAAENRPDTIKVNLLQDGIFYKEYEITKEDGWTKTIKNLPKFDDQGKAYDYTVKEQEVAGYASVANGLDITNTRAETKNIDITKTWLDTEDSADRPDKIEVELFRSIANGKKESVGVYDVTGASNDSNWSKTIKDLPAFDDDGKAYTYEINELKVDGYKTEINGFDITNLRVGKTTISGEKIWKDEDKEDRPDEIIIQVKNGDKVVQEQTIKPDTDGDWTYEFTDLDKYDAQGQIIDYTIDEIEPQGYTKSIDPNHAFNLMNTRSDTTAITINKTWLDTEETAARPDAIDVELFRSVTDVQKEYVKTYTVTKDAKWSLEIKDLPAFNQDGKAYTYEVKEKSVDDYNQVGNVEKTANGFNITNVRVGTTAIEGTKTWLDDDSKDRPKSIDVILTREVNGVVDKHFSETETVKANQDGNWSYAFTDLEEFNDQGVAYDYIVTEDEPAGYQATVDKENNITNLRIGTTEVSGTKTWLDDDSEDSPKEITVHLFANDDKDPTASMEVTAADDWKYTFTKLPKYDNQGKEITYTVKEESITGYEASYSEKGNDITNLRVGTTSVSGEKEWREVNEHYRPDAITVHLFANDEDDPIDSLQVTAADDWKYTFNDLPAYDGKGVAIEYSIQEDKVPGYTSEVEGHNVINTQETTNFSGMKKWLDDDANARPDSITVELYANGELLDGVAPQKVTEDKDGHWIYTFNDLAKYDKKGNEIVYSVKEESVPKGYKSKVEGHNIINLRTGETEVSGTKTWLDDGSEDRPESITVQLLANGNPVDSATVTAEEGWKYEFYNLDKYDDQGKEINYTIDEVTVDGYETLLAETSNGFDITNLRVGTTEVSGTKTWLDDESAERPASITTHLLANGEKTNKKTEITAQDGWEYRFENLPKYDEQGVKISYTVKEDKVEGYKTFYSDNGRDITNLRVGTTEVDITKTWKDEGDTDRPETIKVNLLQNGEFYKAYEINEEDGWKLTISDLPQYDDEGRVYEYSVKEHDVPGYESDVDGFDITNTRTDKKDIEITKTWLDTEKSAKRPKAINIELFRSSEDDEKQSVETYEMTGLENEKNWSLTIEDLPAFDENGNAYMYEIEEEAVDGYKTTINGFDITNLRVGDPGISGEKTWLDGESEKRPERITVILYQNGTQIDEVEATAENNWKYSFMNLPSFDEKGAYYEYTVEEKPTPGYEALVDGYDIRNLRVGTIFVEGEKNWEEVDDKYRPESITINLLANGEQVDSAKVTAEANWKYKFTDLEKYDEQGKEITYTIEEAEIPGYTSEIDGYDVTNTQITKDISGTKTWKNDKEDDRPASIMLQLMNKDEVVQELKVTAESDWTYTFEELPRFNQDGEEINYTLKELPVKGYKAEIDGFDVINSWVEKDIVASADLDEPAMQEEKDTEGQSDQKGAADKQNPDKSDGDLPNTATNTFNMLFVGLLLLLVGISLVIYQRKRLQ